MSAHKDRARLRELAASQDALTRSTLSMGRSFASAAIEALARVFMLEALLVEKGVLTAGEVLDRSRTLPAEQQTVLDLLRKAYEDLDAGRPPEAPGEDGPGP